MRATSPLRSLRDGLDDESLRIAILVGLATVPVTVALSWAPASADVFRIGGSISGEALLFAGLFVGYYYHGRETAARRAGIWTGLIGSLGTVVVFGANSVATIVAASWPRTAVAVLGTLVTLAFGIGFTVFATAIPAIGTDWVLTRLERDHRVVDPESEATVERGDGATGRWLSIVGYAILVPVAFGSMLWLEPMGDGGALITVLLLVLTFFLSIATLVGLFVDATEPRDARTDWLPNVGLYVGGPIAAGALVYLITAVREWGYPAGNGWYGFVAALWLAATVYLVNTYRHERLGRRRVDAA